MKDKIKVYNRQEAIEKLKELGSKGFKYVVRNEAGGWLSCFSTKPIKIKYERYWGYTQKDLNNNLGLPVAIVRNDDITEINWDNKEPKLIKEVAE